MTEVTLDIKQWGNSLGVRLPSAIAREAHLHIDQKVKLSIVDNQIILSPVLEKTVSLEDRLAMFDSKRHGGESMVAAESLGVEKW
mgnify:CR=1 FL=1